MKNTLKSRLGSFLAAAALLACSARAANESPSPLDRVIEKTLSDYTVRLQAATREMEASRARIVAEKAPVSGRLQAVENSVVSLQSELASLQESQAQVEEKGQRLQKEGQVLAKNVSYLNTVARDLVRAMEEGLSPGENADFNAQIEALKQEFEARSSNPVDAALKAFDLASQRLHTQLGGHSAAGKALAAGTNRIVEGTFAFFGPETVFVSRDGTLAGTVRSREGSVYPITYPMAR